MIHVCNDMSYCENHLHCTCKQEVYVVSVENNIYHLHKFTVSSKLLRDF